jgi:RHS repeat-associated protein
VSFTYDNNGNLTDDGTFKYTFDAWNRLVKVTAKDDTDVTVQQARYDALGRRLWKQVINAGDQDGTTVYYYHRHQILQANDGSGNLVMQVYPGIKYIDEVIALRLPHGRAYVHQDANWNVIALTDLTGATLERSYYSPYGELEVVADTYFGDYDGDGYVNAGDRGDLCSNGGGCDCEFTGSVSGDCRIFDFDCDGDLDYDDEVTLESLYTGLSAEMRNRRIPSVSFSPVGNPFGHQGLVLDGEVGSYQNRARQYNPSHKRFMQRDPVGHGGGGSVNLYQYVRNRPLSNRDPSGRVVASIHNDKDPIEIHLFIALWGPDAHEYEGFAIQSVEGIWNLHESQGVLNKNVSCQCPKKGVKVKVSAYVWDDPTGECDDGVGGGEPWDGGFIAQCHQQAAQHLGAHTSVLLDPVLEVSYGTFGPATGLGKAWIDTDSGQPAFDDAYRTRIAHEIGHTMRQDGSYNRDNVHHCYGVGHIMGYAPRTRAPCHNMRDVLNMHPWAQREGPELYKCCNPEDDI